MQDDERCFRVVNTGGPMLSHEGDTRPPNIEFEPVATEEKAIPLDEHVRFILGRPNFWCAPIARALRNDGHEIAEKSEDEQAAVIHWLLGFYLKHGRDAWKDAASAEIERLQRKQTKAEG